MRARTPRTPQPRCAPLPTYEVVTFDYGRVTTLYRNLPLDEAAAVVATYAEMGLFVSCRRTPFNPFEEYPCEV